MLRLVVYVGAGLLAVTAVAGVGITFTESAMFGTGQPYPYVFWLCVAAALVRTEPTTTDETPAANEAALVRT